MHFSMMVLPMYVDADGSRSEDERLLDLAVEQSVLAGALGFSPWYTQHHFRGPWNSAPLEFAAYVAPQLPADRYLGFGVLSVPFYHPVRLVEQMNLLHQLTKGHAVFGLGSGFPGIEPASAGLTDEYHGSGQATRDSLEVMERLWDYESGQEPYEFDTGLYRGRIVKRIMPSAYRRRRPTIVRTARNSDAVAYAARRGWPAFLGTGGADLAAQTQLYREELCAAGHPAEVIEDCRRWSTHDWTSVVVADSDAEAAALVDEARRERAQFRERFLGRSVGLQPVQGGLREVSSSSDGNGRDSPSPLRSGGEAEIVRAERQFEMRPAICGSPDTVAAEVEKVSDLGIDHLMLRFLGEWHGETRPIAERSMHLFAERVMPRFTGAPATPERQV
jgi:alkanesulfonate monooxygenase SsuD/methylene tetrahydromethanopterin reductase-like flavin-dependent oxidoreductase (luciferase family)